MLFKQQDVDHDEYISTLFTFNSEYICLIRFIGLVLMSYISQRNKETYRRKVTVYYYMQVNTH